MRAVVLRELGGPDALRIDSVPDPNPGPGEVVVRLKAAALNHRDVWIRKGQYAGIKLPIILGSDGAGIVVAGNADLMGREVVIDPALNWGADPRCFGADFRILGLPDDGTYAQMVKVPAANVHARPAAWSWAECAALPLAGLTAYRAVVSRAQTQPGETVLVTGIGGGVSQMALQIALAVGARVWVTSTNDDKIARAIQLGAANGVNSTAEGWIKSLVAQTGGGPDVVIDSVGGDMINSAVEACKPGGRVVNYGATTGPTARFEVRRLFWKQVSLLGTTMGRPSEFEAMLDLFQQSGRKPMVDQEFRLDDVADAHRRMEQAGQFGKIVLSID